MKFWVEKGIDISMRWRFGMKKKIDIIMRFRNGLKRAWPQFLQVAVRVQCLLEFISGIERKNRNEFGDIIRHNYETHTTHLSRLSH